MTDLLQEALIAKEKGDLTSAKQLISQALVQQPNNEAAWMLMSDVVEDVRLRRNCLERVLAINPQNTAASAALSKLNTSPLAPILRGERDKPFDPPKLEIVPPFTPPFTWEGEQEQFLALGDMTYPELSDESPVAPADILPTFDWANESPEPDKTIQKIFDSISNPDLASQPLPDTEVNWLDNLRPKDDAEAAATGEGEYEARLLDQLVGTQAEQADSEQQTGEPDFTVSAEPQLGLAAFASPEQEYETVTSDYRLWDNPKVRTDRMVILSNKALIYASPKESDVPHILGLFAENRMMRDLLGDNARIIRLEIIRRLVANPKLSTISIEYKERDEKAPSRHEIKFSSAQVIDEVLDALLIRLGPGFSKSIHSVSLADKISSPLITLLLIALFGWVLLAGIPMLSQLPNIQGSAFQVFMADLNSLIASINVFYIFLAAIIAAALTLIWLLNNLRQPSRLVIVERQL